MLSKTNTNLYHQQRIVAMDVLRGVALLGILIMNIQSFGLLSGSYLNPMVTTSGESINIINWISYSVSHIVADQKFMTIFSVLFGSSLALQFEKTASLKRSGLIRRNGILLIIGLLHAYLLWPGDILVTYALCSIPAIALLKQSNTRLLWMSACVFLVPVVIVLINNWLVPYYSAADWQQLQTEWHPSDSQNQAQIDAMTGSWLQQFPYRISAALTMQLGIFPLETGWRVLALMLIGIVLYRRGFYSTWPAKHHYKMIIIGLTLGSGLVGLGLYQHHTHHWQAEYSLFIGSVYNYLGSAMMGLAYASIVILICRKPYCLYRFKKSMAAVGRMALSNYLLQSVIGTTIFYGYGLGLYEQLTRAQLWLLLIPIWLFQVYLSTLWLTYFKQGPVEYVWRKLSKKTH